jgi:acyl-CoA reductase-like NAD-dependent aldehyde dehydrogenase
MTKRIAPELEWPHLVAQCRALVPEAFASDGRPLNLMEGEWTLPGSPRPYTSPVDGRVLGELPMLEADEASRAVRFAASESYAWGATDLDERRRRVRDCLDALSESRELLGRLLMWEIGKTHALAMTDVDRCVDGVEWYLAESERMLPGRRPVGVISNIASSNYPYSVLMHAVLVQLLAGNAVIAKTPTDGGLFALTVGFALARRAGLPVSLVSGAGRELNAALVRSPEVGCLAFVGGRSSGRAVAASVVDQNRRHMLEMEGVNAYGVWEYSDWGVLAAQIRKGFDYGKQRCTAYARYVVQRKLLPDFLDAYLPVLRALRIGNPVAVDGPEIPFPELDFGPLINAEQVESLHALVREATDGGGYPIYQGEIDPDRLLPEQDASAYMAPVALLAPPRNSELYHKEPFGPVDSIVVVDRPEHLIAEMNVSNGCLVATLACDDPHLGAELAAQVRAFKVGVNRMRSRGDREEVFGGIGESWKGCFVGGRLLIESVTHGPVGERLFGNFPDYTLLPARR